MQMDIWLRGAREALIRWRQIHINGCLAGFPVFIPVTAARAVGGFPLEEVKHS